MTEIERLQKAIKDLHGCDSAHAASIPVHETFQGKTAWEGIVEVFMLANHAKGVSRAYAWSYKTDDGETRYVAILGVPPINSALNAVQPYIVAEAKKEK
jgi:N-acetylglutamate synthase-like GNAT family acetyltransferase